MSKVARQANHGRTGKAAYGANSLHRSPIHLLHRAEQSAQDIFSAELKISGLTARQLAVHVTVSENEGLSQAGICDRTGINQATVTDIVRRMEKKTLLQRRRLREDARVSPPMRK